MSSDKPAQTPSGNHAAERIIRRSEPRAWPKRVRGKRRKKTYPWAKATLVTTFALVASLVIMWNVSAHPLETVIGHITAIATIVALVLVIVGVSAFRIIQRPAFKAGVVTLVVALLAFDGFVYFKIQHLTGNLTAGESLDSLGNRPTDPTAGKALNILVMGVDTRSCAGCKIDGEHGGDASDTTILIHVSADRTWATGISIPRDSMVNRPAGCTGTNGAKFGAENYVMWNAAFALGNYDCTIRQFEATTGIRLSHYVVVNFGSFVSMVDALGGVQVCLPEDLNDSVANIHFTKGQHVLTGPQALEYVRVRHGIADGSDLTRTRRQQAFIGSMVSKALSGDTLSNPGKLYSFLDAATKGLTIDPEFKSLPTLMAVAQSLKHIGLGSIRFITIPVGPDPRNPLARVVWTSEAAQVWDSIKHDRPLSNALSSTAINAGSVPGSSASATPTGTATGTGSTTSSPSATATTSSGATNQQLASAGLCSSGS